MGSFGIGLFQIAKAAGRAPSRLLAIEPGAELGAHVAANLQRAMPQASALIPFAVGPESGHLVAVATPDASSNHGAIAYEVQPDDSVTGIESRALWQLREQHGNYDFLKLDLEGMEIDAIKSDFDYLKERKPVIWAECNESWRSVLILEAMVALGYKPIYLAFPAFRQDNFCANSDLPFGMAYEAVLVAAKPERMAQLDIDAIPEAIIRRDVRTSFDLRKALWATPRWAEPEWVSMNRAELIGLLGHVISGHKLEEFLTHDTSGTSA